MKRFFAWITQLALAASIGQVYDHENVNQIWEEDLKVEVCYEGWPGLPEQNVVGS